MFIIMNIFGLWWRKQSPETSEINYYKKNQVIKINIKATQAYLSTPFDKQPCRLTAAMIMVREELDFVWIPEVTGLST